MPHKRISKKPSQTGAPEDRPGMNDAKRIEPKEAHVDSVGQRRPDLEGGDEAIVNHPDDSENERAQARPEGRIDEANADGEAYETERSGAV